jgi:hypothetical protein
MNQVKVGDRICVVMECQPFFEAGTRATITAVEPALLGEGPLYEADFNVRGNTTDSFMTVWNNARWWIEPSMFYVEESVQ